MQHQVTSVLNINAPADKVWSILDDFGGVEKFSIGIDKASLIGDKSTGLGAKRKCVFHDQNSVVEEIIEYQANESFKVVLTESAMPMKTITAEFRVEKLTDTTCQVIMTMEFVMKLGFVGSLLGYPMRSMLKGIQQQLLKGLAYHAFTGHTLVKELPEKDQLSASLIAG